MKFIPILITVWMLKIFIYWNNYFVVCYVEYCNCLPFAYIVNIVFDMNNFYIKFENIHIIDLLFYFHDIVDVDVDL